MSGGKPPESVSLADRDKAFFDNANKNHTHQDNLRWSLAAGFAAFFYGGVKLVYDPDILPNASLTTFLEMSLVVLGTIYFLILLVEGWYYNLYLAYLVECEKRLALGKAMFPMAELDRQCVRSIHPSWFLVLMLVAVANTYHLFEVVWRYGAVWAYATVVLYVAVVLSLSVWGHVPQWIDATLDRLHGTGNGARVDKSLENSASIVDLLSANEHDAIDFEAPRASGEFFRPSDLS